jgi:kinesin family protein C1
MENVESKYKVEIETLSESVSSLKKEKDLLAQELNLSKSENVELRGCISSQSTTTLVVESQLKATKTQLEVSLQQISEQQGSIEALEAKYAAAQESIKELENKLHEEETVRRQLHNTIQELKGNIRVFCRIRPLLGAESEANTLEHLKFTDDNEGAITLNHSFESASGVASTKEYPFTFDKVFQPATSQKEVFDEISQLVQSALDGYNVCIFAYGQTGSGKTFTMEGPGINHMDEDNMGMIPRAVEQIYATAEKLKGKGWEFSIEGQYLEIYNETIRDLIGTPDATKKYEIKHSGAQMQGKTYVTDITTGILS